MALSTDRTLEFRECANEKAKAFPPSKRPRTTTSDRRRDDDEWTKQANQVATNLRTFDQFLASIRRAYLDLSSTSASSSLASHRQQQQQPQRTIDQSQGLAAWQGVKWLTDRERDEIDFAVKVALRKSVDRVRQLEDLEKVRLSNEKRSLPPAPSGLSKLLGLPHPSSSSSSSSDSEALATHRSLITLYLNELLQTVSTRQRVQQETRVQRQLDKSQSLGGLGGGGALGMDRLGHERAERSQGERDSNWGLRGKGRGGDDTEPERVGTVPSIFRPNPTSNRSPFDPARSNGFDHEGSYADDDAEEEEEDGLDHLSRELTQAQIQQFEAEESALLASTESDLSALRTAESSLLEIAALQTQLAVHLSQQSEKTDQLWEDAVFVSGRVDEGNKQLKKAKERGRDSRVWLLVFLFGSSFTLLFLDYYSS
ncbi:hypothetical protein JCM10212_007055 [Sporobolomyces blumeae]